MVGTALIGKGKWGSCVAEALADVSDFKGSADKAGAVSVDDVLARPDVKAVWIATPIATHADIAKRALAANKHIMVEKPLAQTTPEAEMLCQLARTHKRLIATGYVFLFDPAYHKFKKRLAGRTITAVSMRWDKHGTFEEDITGNLLTHHLAFALDLFGEPRDVRGLKKEAAETSCDRITIALAYSGFEVTSAIDRASAARQHSLTVTFDDGTQAIWTSEPGGDPLRAEAEAFVAALESGAALHTSGNFGVRVLSLQDRVTAAFGADEDG